MTTLHFGVIDQPYPRENRTTGEVAEILEAKYHIMEIFYRRYATKIGDQIDNSMMGALESLLMGQSVDPWGPAAQAIQQQFRDFISSREVESMGIPGTPTYAALMGYSRRRKHPHARGPRRPSFRDSGLYMGSFRVWVDGE